MTKEIRAIENDVELRKAEDGSDIITGYAVVFNSESRDLGGFTEVISPDAFRNTDMTDVVALFNHKDELILGRTPGTLTLSVDGKGVRYSIKPPDTTAARDLMVSIKRGDVRGSSFGFTVSPDGDTWEKPVERGGIYRRFVKNISKLWDVSPVTNPAYVSTDTSIAKRSLGMERDKEEREVSEAIQLEENLKAVEEAKRLREQNWMKGLLTLHKTFDDKIAREEEAHRKAIEKQNLRLKREQNRFKNDNL